MVTRYMEPEIEKGSLKLSRGGRGGYGALPGLYPIPVKGGDFVAVTAWQFKYRGPQTTLFVCWGIKKPGDFPADLLDGLFAWSQITVIANQSSTFLQQAGTCNARLLIPASFESLTFPVDTHDWVCKAATPTANVADLVSGIVDLDNGILTLAAFVVPELTDLNVKYEKVV